MNIRTLPSSNVPMLSKVAVVTGADVPAGKQTVRRFLSDGYVVHAAGRQFAEMADLERDGAILHYLDTNDAASVRACTAAILAYGALTGRKEIELVTNEAGEPLYNAGDVVTLPAQPSAFCFAAMKERLMNLLIPLPRRDYALAVSKAACQ